MVDKASADKPVRGEDSSQAQQVVAFIRKAIREGRILPGERIIEREIARDMALGRGPVREAIQDLVKQGLLVRPRQRSPRVKVLSREEVFDFLEVWDAVGPMLMRLVATKIRIRDNAERVRGAMARMSQARSERKADLHGATKAGAAYLETLLDVAGNPVLRRVCENLGLDLYIGSISRVSKGNDFQSSFAAVEKALFEETPERVEAEYKKLVAALTHWVRMGYHPELSGED